MQLNPLNQIKIQKLKSPDYIKCPQCKQENQENLKHCTQCGKQLQ